MGLWILSDLSRRRFGSRRRSMFRSQGFLLLKENVSRTMLNIQAVCSEPTRSMTVRPPQDASLENAELSCLTAHINIRLTFFPGTQKPSRVSEFDNLLQTRVPVTVTNVVGTEPLPLACTPDLVHRLS